MIVGDAGTTPRRVHTRRERRSLTERAVRQRCRDLVRTLGLARPVEPVRLVQCLAGHRDRPLVLEARSLPGACAFGLLVSLPALDMIVYPADVAPAYQAQIIYHEVMHLWLDHLGPVSHEPGGDDGLLAVGTCGPGGDGAPNCSVYDRREEWEAETGATILSEWSAGPAAVAATDVELTIARALGSRGYVA